MSPYLIYVTLLWKRISPHPTLAFLKSSPAPRGSFNLKDTGAAAADGGSLRTELPGSGTRGRRRRGGLGGLVTPIAGSERPPPGRRIIIHQCTSKTPACWRGTVPGNIPQFIAFSIHKNAQKRTCIRYTMTIIFIQDTS